MLEPSGTLSRRALIAAVGGLVAASTLEAEAAIVGKASSGAPAARVRRISLVVGDAAAVAGALERFLGSATRRLTPPIEHAGISAECFCLGDVLIEVSQLTVYDGHLLGLEMSSPHVLRQRARAAGLRLVRDMTIRGRLLIQPEMEAPGVRIEATAPLAGASSNERAVAVTRLELIADEPRRIAAQAAALFGGFARDSVASFDASRLSFVAPKDGDSRRGIVQVELTGPNLTARNARIAGIDWAIRS